MSELLELFTLPLIGGALIGLSAALLLLFNGRIAGISGIFGTALSFPDGDSLWRWTFTAGLVVGGAGLFFFSGPATFANTVDRPVVLVALAGLLVGFGTRLGSGCTSGHGICGVSRFSTRSLVAVVTFIFTGAVAVLLTRALS